MKKNKLNTTNRINAQQDRTVWARKLGSETAFALTLALCAALAGCVGEDGGGEVGGGANPPPTSDSSKLSGYAATGMPVPAGTAIQVQCAGGKTSTTTASDGGYAVLSTGLTFPCVLRATWGAPSQSLYSFANAAGIAQITPLTHTLVSQASNGAPETLFNSPSATALQAVGAQLPGLQARLRQLLTDQGLGASLAGVPDDFFTTALLPAVGGGGNAYDRLLDAVKAKVGTPEALAAAFGQVFAVDLGLYARVEWSRCANAPVKSNDGSYTATGCRTNSVYFSKDPYIYLSRGTIQRGRINMTISTSAPELSGAKCYLNISYSESNAGPPKVPSWINGTGYSLNGWDTTVIDPRSGLASGGEPGSSGNFEVGGGIVTANGPDDGAVVVQIRTPSGRGGLFFENGFLRRATMLTGDCSWAQ